MPMRSKLIILNPISYYSVSNAHCDWSVEGRQVDKMFGIRVYSVASNRAFGVMNESKVRIIEDIPDMVTR